MKRKGLFKFPALNIAVILAITVFFALFLPKSVIDNDLTKILRKEHPSMVAWDEVKKNFGSSDLIVIGFKTDKDSIINPEYLDMIDKITKETSEIVYTDKKTKKKTDEEKASVTAASPESNLLEDFDTSAVTTEDSTTQTSTESNLLDDFAETTETEQVQKDSSDKSPPAIPSDLRITQNNNSVILNWKNPQDKDFDHIELNWTPRAEKEPVIITGGSASATVNNLDFDDNMTFSIKAVDINGNKSKAAALKYRTTISDGYQLVEDVMSLTDIDYIEGVNEEIKAEKLIDIEKNGLPVTEDQLNNFKKRLASWDMYKLNIISDDYKSTAIYLKIAAGTTTKHHEQVYNKAMKIVNKYKTKDVQVYVSGSPAITVLVGENMAKDLKRLVPFVLLIVIITLFLSFKKLGGVILPLTCVIISTIWAIGLMALLGKKIDIISSTIPTILIAVGSAYGIHILTHYYHKTKTIKKISEDEHKTMVLDIVKEVGLPVFLASITTIAGFLSFVTTPLDTMINFGIFSAFGVFAAVVVALILIPSVLLLRHKALKPSDFEENEDTSFMTKFMMGFYHFLSKKKYRIIFLTLIIVVISLIGISKINIDSQLIKYFKQNSTISAADRYLNEIFAGTNTLDLTIKGAEKGDLANPEILFQMDRLSTFLKNKYPQIKKTIGYHDFIKRMNQVIHYGYTNKNSKSDGSIHSTTSLDEISARELLSSLNLAAQRVNKSNPTTNEVIEELDKIYNYDGKLYNEIPMDIEKYGVADRNVLKELVSQYLVLYSGNLSDYSGSDTLRPDIARISIIITAGEADFIKKVMSDVKDFAANNFPEGYSVQISGNSDIALSINNLVVFGQIWSFLFSLFVVFIIISISYRSLIAGIIGIIPLSVTIFINFGLMGFMKIDLNLATAIIASIAIGTGIDYTIHFLSGYSANRKKSDDLEVVTKNTLMSVGKAILFNAVSVGLGFAVLGFSNFVPLVNVGILMLIAMMTSSMGAMMLLPVILNIFDPKFLRK